MILEHAIFPIKEGQSKEFEIGALLRRADISKAPLGAGAWKCAPASSGRIPICCWCGGSVWKRT